jgi:hypothetical protein
MQDLNSILFLVTFQEWLEFVPQTAAQISDINLQYSQ